MREIFTDSGSESDFSGFEDDELPENETESNMDSDTEANEQRNVPSGYDHPWLKNFFRPGYIGALNIPEDFSEYEIMSLFLTSDLIDICVEETNRYMPITILLQITYPPTVVLQNGKTQQEMKCGHFWPYYC